MTIPAKGWAITEPLKGGGRLVLGFTFSHTRREAIAKLTRLYSDPCPGHRWSYWYSRGHRAAQVEIREARS